MHRDGGDGGRFGLNRDLHKFLGSGFLFIDRRNGLQWTPVVASSIRFVRLDRVGVAVVIGENSCRFMVTQTSVVLKGGMPHLVLSYL